MPRPTKLTPERAEIVIKLVREGHHYETAARAAGVSYVTLYNWINRGERSKSGIYFEFFNDLKKAEAESEQALVQRVLEHSKQTWQAAAWVLERRFPDRWRQRQSVEHSGGDKPIDVRLSGIDPHKLATDPELRSAVERIIAELGSRESDAGGTGSAGES